MHPSSEPTTVTVWCARPLRDGVGAQWLSPDEAARAARFHHDEDRRRFTTGRALVRAAVGARLGLAPRAVDVRLGAQDGSRPGKPFVVGGPSFSVAHADRWVLVAVLDGVGPGGPAAGSPDGSSASRPGRLAPAPVEGGPSTGGDVPAEVGVDVESVAPARDHLGDLVAAVPPEERPVGGWSAESFTRSWVRREAVLKAVGTGLLAPRGDLVLARADAAAGVVRSGGALPSPDRLAVRDLALPGRGAGDGCLAAVAVCLRHPATPAGRTLVATLADGDDLLARSGLETA